jgi:disulfide bond formation protein DsbB
MSLADIVNLTLSDLTLAGQILIIVLSIIILARAWKTGTKNGGSNTHSSQIQPTTTKILSFISRNGILLAFIVALVSMSGSLTYSDILGYEPCKLCWFQRICMYPEVLLLGVALYRREKSIIPYALLLAVFGEIIALYHYIVQLGLVPAPCTVSGYSVSCAKKFVLTYGYITIPLMAFTAFVMIIYFLMLAQKERTN